jgi:hypothetical protein
VLQALPGQAEHQRVKLSAREFHRRQRTPLRKRTRGSYGGKRRARWGAQTLTAKLHFWLFRTPQCSKGCREALSGMSIQNRPSHGVVAVNRMADPRFLKPNFTFSLARADVAACPDLPFRLYGGTREESLICSDRDALQISRQRALSRLIEPLNSSGPIFV